MASVNVAAKAKEMPKPTVKDPIVPKPVPKVVKCKSSRSRVVEKRR